MATASTLFCFGLGYTARALAADLREKGWIIRGTTRDPDKAKTLASQGIQALVMSSADESPLPNEALLGVTHLLSSVPPDNAGDPVLRCYGAPIAEHAAALQWIGYLSTTGVYGDRSGGWVDEETPCTPTLGRAEWRLAAEQAWRGLGRSTGRPVQLFRLAGIYGPGRNALATVRAGRARRIVKPGQVFSRAHIDDIVQVVCASIARPRAGAVYNVCDDEAAPPQDVIAHACELLDVPAPPETPFDEAKLSDMARNFYADNKRVRNDLIKRELGVELRYPTYRDGLRALLGDDAS